MRTRQLVRDLIRKTPNPERRYINDRGTLITIAVRAHHDGLRDERVTRARDAVARVEPERKMSGISYPEGRDKYDRAADEVKTAKRIANDRRANPDNVCVVHVSPVKMPRRWPNALPGGTSPRRANKRGESASGRQLSNGVMFRHRQTSDALAEYMLSR